LRSIRRGSLTTLAEQGVPEDVLMQVSGHASVQTLKRYLGYGLHMEDRAKHTTEATKVLWT
jgi:integrase